MISRLIGVLEDKTAGSIVIMAGGVGYEVFIPLSTFYELPEEGREVSLYIKTVVREDAIDLFGFLTPAERAAFLLLNSVSKIGPRLAISILSGIGPGELIDAIHHKNVSRLCSVPGVGAKTAERLILELKDKAVKLAAAIGPVSPKKETPSLDEIGQDVVSALVNLGYSGNEAERAVSKAAEEAEDSQTNLPALLRLSLKKLQKA